MKNAKINIKEMKKVGKIEHEKCKKIFMATFYGPHFLTFKFLTFIFLTFFDRNFYNILMSLLVDLTFLPLIFNINFFTPIIDTNFLIQNSKFCVKYFLSKRLV